jgi:NADPH2:quinone reductase
MLFIVRYSGLGQWLVQIAKSKGATVIGTVSNQEKENFVKNEYGIEHVINYRAQDVVEEVKRITNGQCSVRWCWKRYI